MIRANDTIPGELDRLPPHSIEAEICLLASMMLADRDARDEVRAVVNPSQFFQVDHKILFTVINDLDARGGAVDAILVREELIRRQLLEEVGGVPYLAEILNKVPSAAHALHYGRIVAEKAKWREIITACNDTLRIAYAPAKWDRADEAAAELEKAVAAVRENGSADTIRRLGDLIDEVLEQKKSGVATRRLMQIPSLDELTGGVPIGGLTYVAAGPGMGKSAFIKQIGINLADDGIAFGVISLEESGGKIAENLLSNWSGVTNANIVYNALGEHEWNALEEAAGRLRPLSYYIDDTPVKLSAIATSARRLVRKYGCKVIAVDHEHLVQADGTAARETREQELATISSGLKSLWKELGVAGIVACQLNRGGTSDEFSPPSMRNLRGSGMLEADGDLIMLLHRPDYYAWKKDPHFTPNHQLQVHVDKNKGGPVGQVLLHFNGDRQEIGEWNNGLGPRASFDDVDPFKTP